MDFDPSQFLSMNITEDNQEIVLDTGPENEPQPIKDGENAGIETVQIEKENEEMDINKVMVTGGLQIEPVELPIPMFDTLFGSANEMIENNFGPIIPADDPLQGTVPDGNGDDSGLLPGLGNDSLVERANSPSDDRIRKGIQTSYDEQRFRRDVFAGAYERVKLFKLHCTSCERHLGCAPNFTTNNMRSHKLLNLAVCRNCFEFYGNRNFPIEDGSEIYCCWCGEGGDLYCCSTCPKTVCQKCVLRNFDKQKVTEIEKNDNWKCFICNPEDIYPHRSIYWAWQNLVKKMRQSLVNAPKETKDLLLSKDTSDCCSDDPIEINFLSFPPKSLLLKFPQCLIAPAHISAVNSLPNETNSMGFPSNRSVLSRDINGTGRMPVNRVTPQLANILKTPHSIPSNRFRQLPPAMNPMSTIVRSPSMGYQQAVNGQQPGMMPMLHQQRMMPPPYQQRMMPPPYQQRIMHPPHQQVQRSRPYPMPMPYRPPQPAQARPKPSNSNLLMTALYSNQPPSQHSMLDLNQTQTVDLVDVDSPPMPQSSGLDISWLEQGIQGYKECFNPIRSQISQFNIGQEELRNNISSLSKFVDKLSYNTKIAICQLAKLNTNLQEAKKAMVDNQVASVVSQLSNVTKKTADDIVNKLPAGISHSVQVIPVAQKVPPESPSTSESPLTSESPSNLDESMTINPALLCETVMETEMKNDGVKQMTKALDSKTEKKVGRTKKDLNVLKIKKQLMAKMKNKPRRSATTNDPLAVVDISDDEETSPKRPSFNPAIYLRKFNIQPARVMVKRCDD